MPKMPKSTTINIREEIQVCGIAYYFNQWRAYINVFLVFLLMASFNLFAKDSYIEEMVLTYDANQARFHQKYRGTGVSGKGVVEKISADFLGTGSVFFVNINISGSEIKCIVTNRDSAASLNKGDNIQFQGRVFDVILGIPTINDCVFSKPNLTNSENKNDSYDEYINYSKLSETITALTEALGGHRFENYRVEIFRGKYLPSEDMKKDSKGYFIQITSGKKYYELGPNFAGRYYIDENGCGTECRYVKMHDLATGASMNAISMFSSMEDANTKEGLHYVTDLYHKPDSNLLVVQYHVFRNPKKDTDCREKSFIFQDKKFVPIDKTYYSCSKIPSKFNDSETGD